MHNPLNRSKRYPQWVRATTLLLMSVFLMLAFQGNSSCNSPAQSYDVTQSSTQYQFIDIAGAGGCVILSAKSDYGCIKSSPVSFWMANGRLTACTHLTDSNDYIADISGCLYHTSPAQLPPNATLAAFNTGDDVVTQSVWMSSAGYYICQHDVHWLDLPQIAATSCVPFAKPAQLSPTATLQTMNSGLNVIASEMWMDGGKYWRCNVRQTFLPDGHIESFTSGNRIVGKCQPYSLPTDQLPSGASNLQLVGFNSDSDLPWEFFFMATYNGVGRYVVRCNYNATTPPWTLRYNSNWFEDYTDISNCNWFPGLHPADLP